jgi:hypothetical protein
MGAFEITTGAEGGERAPLFARNDPSRGRRIETPR